MLTLRLEVSDLASVRFGYSPIQEVAQSMWVLRHPEQHPLHARWRTAALPLLEDCNWPLLSALEGPLHWIPDFLTPYPTTNIPRFADELDILRSTEPSRIRHDIHAAHVDIDGHPLPLPAALARADEDPAGMRGAIADAIDRYWNLLIAPHWPRLRDVLDSDIDFRARQLASVGASELFNGLDRRLSWHDGRLELSAMGLDAACDVDGRGLMLTPSLFANAANSMIDERLPPVLCYPARGRAQVWSTGSPAGARLSGLLGATRAALLAELSEPATTTQLAVRLNLTAGGVSQQLQILYRGGLLRRTRAGRVVTYQRSPLGQQLVRAAGPTGQA